MLKSKSKHIFINSILILCFLGTGVAILISGNKGLVLLLATIAFAMVMIRISQDIHNNIFIFCFLICFFVFLLGGQILDRIFDVYGYVFTDEIELHTDIVLLISILGLSFGYFFLAKVRIKTHKRRFNHTVSDNLYSSPYILNIRKISKYYYYSTYLLWILIICDNVLFVLQRGYTTYYLSYSSRIPAIVREFGYMAPVALFIFLATMPEKKEAKLPIILYSLYLVLSLGTGRRIYLMTGLLIIFAYLMLRNKINPGNSLWISKRQMARILLIIPFVLIGMYLFEYLRSENYVGQSSDYNPIFGFFVRQGTSINVIKYARLFSDRLNSDAHYSLYNITRWLQNNWLNDLLGLDLSYSMGRQSELTATQGTYLADFVSYHANSRIYSIGMGYGSCYIEELYIDFGYIGVFIGNAIYGLVLNKLLKISESRYSVWKTAIGLFAIDAIFKAPRATYDAFIGQWLYFNSWGPLVIIYLLSYFSMKMNSFKPAILNQGIIKK